jgi:hypothetical protein
MDLCWWDRHGRRVLYNLGIQLMIWVIDGRRRIVCRFPGVVFETGWREALSSDLIWLNRLCDFLCCILWQNCSLDSCEIVNSRLSDVWCLCLMSCLWFLCL